MTFPRCTTSTYLLSTDPTDLSRGADSAVARHCLSSPSSSSSPSPSSLSSVFSFSSSPLSSSWLLYIYTSRLPQLIIAMRCLLTQLFLSLTPIWQKDYLHWGSRLWPLIEMKSQLFSQTPFDGSPQKYMSMKLSNPKYFCSQPKVKCSRDCFHLDPRGPSVSSVVTIFSHSFDCSTTLIHLNFHSLP